MVVALPNLYLRPNAVLEPLVGQWYAWPLLIAPATAAMTLVERQLGIMESYVKTPQVHESAVKNPAMLGGPFINYPSRRVADVQALIERTKRERGLLLDLHAALRALDALLLAEAKGTSLEPFYPRVPEILRGYVELVYDLRSQPSFRVLEGVLYRSPFYDESAQSVMLSLVTSDERPFILSTPRLEDDNHVHVQIPLRHEGLDALFAMERAPAPLGTLRERLGLSAAKEEALRPMFSPDPPPPRPPYQGPGVRWRYFGHACVLVESVATTILVDPVLSYAFPADVPRFTFGDLPDEIDYVVITHTHADHVLLETLLRLRHKIKHVIVPRCNAGALQDPSLKTMLSILGFPDVRELDHLERIELADGSIIGLPFLGEHGDLDISSKLAYRVEIGGRTLVFAADSRNLEPRLYAHLRRDLGEVDVLFLGMECDGAPMSWIYGPLLSRPLSRKEDQSRRLAGSDYEHAQAIVDTLGCAEVYVYAMGQEPWLGYVMSVKYTERSTPIVASNRLVAACTARGLVAERLYAKQERVLA